MQICFEASEMRALIHEVVREVLSELGWPEGRLALDEAEAARACGVCRHVLRDLRLGGKITARKLGRKVLYTRKDLLRALADLSSGKE